MRAYSFAMTDDISRRRLIGGMGVALAAWPASGRLAAARGADPTVIDLPTGSGRICAVTHWQAARRRGTILFSHGAFSSPTKYDRLIAPWVAAGYDVWAPLHVDSTDHPDTKNFTGLMSWRARIEDMRALSDHIGTHPRIAAGHSYGALVALTLGGAAADTPDGLSGPLNDPRVSAVIAFSPPGPAEGLVSREGYGALAVPALIQTGDRDIPPTAPGRPLDPDGWKAHLIPFDAAFPGKDRYALVLDGVDHYFGGLICRLDLPGPPQSIQMQTAVDVSRLFLDAFGRRSQRAR